MAKKQKPDIPGQIKHKSLKEAMDHIRKVMTELHVDTLKKLEKK